MKLAILRITLLLALGLPTQIGIAAESLFNTLTQQGVELSADETTKLPQPVLADGLDATAQRQAIETLLADRYEWDQFTRKSVVSPLLLKIDDPDRESGRISRRVDLYFIAYGELDIFGDDRKLQEQLNLASSGDVDSDASQVTVLSPAQLAKRGISAVQSHSSDKEGQRWVAVEATLLNKVQLALTTPNEKLETNDSLLVASALDPKFQNDAEFPNCWRAITFDDAGRRQIGPPQPYIGLGSYVKATRLAEPAGAVFIEYHVVYAEPQGWFRGANLLRSKLPIVAQDIVRKLRRKMAEQ